MRLTRTLGYRISDVQKEFIIQNIKRLSVTEICNKIGVKDHQVYNCCFNQGIKISDYVAFSDSDVEFIRMNYSTMSHIQIGKIIGRSRWSIKAKAKSLNLKRSEDAAKLIQSINTCATQFKKGAIPHNTKTDFEITIRSPHRGVSYKFIRISLANWIPLQIFNWEKVNGPIPEDKILRSISGNTLDCSPENWEPTDRADHLAKNSGRKTLEDKYISSLLSIRDKPLRAVISQYPELIELKKNQLKLRRTINELNKTSEVNR